MVNKTVLTQLSELLEKRDLKEIAAGTIVEAAEVTDHGNVSLSARWHLNIIKAVREKMAEAMNATVEITGGHLDLSDVSDKTILFVAVGAGEKFCN